MTDALRYLTVPAFLATAAAGYATVYHSVESAQKACFPSATRFVEAPVTLTPPQAKAVEKASGVRVRVKTVRAWRVEENGKAAGWFLVDEVLGKHEFITYALALGVDGSVRGIEVMDYRETYGYEIRQADWRAQFLGKKHGATLKLDVDIRNISGATLSCRHVTDGVKRMLAVHELILR